MQLETSCIRQLQNAKFLVVHPAYPIDANSNIVILVKPYGFCKAWYDYYDLVVASCKHTYHPICLAKLLKNEINIVFVENHFTQTSGPTLDFAQKK
jgi:hypothetical protein